MKEPVLQESFWVIWRPHYVLKSCQPYRVISILENADGHFVEQWKQCQMLLIR